MPLTSGFHPLALVFFLMSLVISVSAAADSSMAMGYKPKYSENFKHFDYVNANAQKGGSLMLSAFGTFDSLNPYVLKGNPAEGLSLVFESLLEKSLDEPFSVYGLLAEDMQLASDKLSVTFHLNPAAKFSNGEPVLAEDVKFSFDTLMSDKAHPQYQFYYADVLRAVVLNTRTIRFDFKQVNAELHLIIGDISVFSKTWLQGKDFDKVTEVIPISSGPYTVESFDLGKRIVYKRNPYYWAHNLPVRRGMYNFDKVTYKYFKDPTVAMEAFKSGEFDFLYELSSKAWARDHVGPRYDSGQILKTTLSHKNIAGMQGFVFNLRRDLFKDQRVRQALSLAFDFEWANSHLFYNQYVRNDSYFSNSELAATGIPQGAELKLLEPYRSQLPPELFTKAWTLPTSPDAAALRNNLKQAKQLLTEAGWQVKNNVLVNQEGRAFEFEFLLQQKSFERVLAPYARNLKKLGIVINYRTVDRALYEKRVRTFDFDMMVMGFGQSASPGNEQRNMFHSSTANEAGSNNIPGIAHPVVDALVEKIIFAKDREQLVTACQALDRVLLHQNYIVPNWYINKHRVAYKNVFVIPETEPLYYTPETWLLKTWSMRDKPGIKGN